MTQRNAKALEKMTLDQRAAVESIRINHSTPEYRAEEMMVREEVKRSYIPAPRLTDEEYAAIQERAAEYKNRLDLWDNNGRPTKDNPTSWDGLGDRLRKEILERYPLIPEEFYKYVTFTYHDDEWFIGE